MTLGPEINKPHEMCQIRVLRSETQETSLVERSSDQTHRWPQGLPFPLAQGGRRNDPCGDIEQCSTPVRRAELRGKSTTWWGSLCCPWAPQCAFYTHIVQGRPGGGWGSWPPVCASLAAEEPRQRNKWVGTAKQSLECNGPLCAGWHNDDVSPTCPVRAALSLTDAMIYTNELTLYYYCYCCMDRRLSRVTADFNGTRASDIYVINFGAHFHDTPKGDEDFKRDASALLDGMARLGERATVIWRYGKTTLTTNRRIQ